MKSKFGVLILHIDYLNLKINSIKDLLSLIIIINQMIKSMSNLLRISPIVESALKYGKPVVALESTIISHGMPYPQNKLCAISIE
jgi:hypothetical protein